MTTTLSLSEKYVSSQFSPVREVRMVSDKAGDRANAMMIAAKRSEFRFKEGSYSLGGTPTEEFLTHWQDTLKFWLADESMPSEVKTPELVNFFHEIGISA